MMHAKTKSVYLWKTPIETLTRIDLSRLYSPIGHAVKAALEALGETPDEIAQTLGNKGIKGVRRHGHYCPLTMYLQEQFPELGGEIAVGYIATTFRRPDHELDNIFMDSAWSDFARLFDSGQYPELEETELPAGHEGE